jgi:hypothetical protein
VPVTEHVKFTAPVKPPAGMTKTTAVDGVPAGLVAVAGVLLVNESASACPVPFPQPAVQATTTGADPAEAAKFVSPLYVATMLLLPGVNSETATSALPVLKYSPVAESRTSVSPPLVPRTAPLTLFVNVTVPLGNCVKQPALLGRTAAVMVTVPEEIEFTLLVTEVEVPAFSTVNVTLADVLAL